MDDEVDIDSSKKIDTSIVSTRIRLMGSLRKRELTNTLLFLQGFISNGEVVLVYHIYDF